MQTLAFIKTLLTAGTLVAGTAVGLICLVGLVVWLAGSPPRPSR